MKQLCWICGDAPAVMNHQNHPICGDCFDEVSSTSPAPKQHSGNLTNVLTDIVDLTLAGYGITVPQARQLRVVEGKNA